MRPIALLTALLPPFLLPARAQQFAPVALPPSIGAFTLRATLGDYDRDGDMDLYVAQSGFFPPASSLFANDGTGRFTDVSSVLPPHLSPQSTPAFVDIDGDGDLDLLVWQVPTARLFRNDGPGPWTDLSANLPAPVPFAVRHVVGDFDGDGDLDLAGVGHALAWPLSRNHLLVNQGAGVFTLLEPFPGTDYAIATADIDGDGDLDLVTSTWGLRLWRNDGGLSFTDVTATQLPTLPQVRDIVFGDVDGDGDQDLAVGYISSTGSGADVLLRNLGNGTFVAVPGALPPALGSAQSMTLVDVDEDGDLDLFRGSTGHGPTLARNDGTGFFTDDPASVPPAASPSLLVVGDLDRDGDLDAVVHAYGAGAVMWVNRHRHVTSSGPPTIGQSWSVNVWSQPGYGTTTRLAQVGIGLLRLPQPLDLPPFGVLWLDFQVPVLITTGFVSVGASAATFPFAIPLAPQLVGTTLHVQGLVEETLGVAGVRLTSLLSTTIQ